MLTKIIQFVKKHQDDIILVIGVILISLLSFGVGYITATREKEPIKIEKIQQIEQYGTTATFRHYY